MRLIKHCPPPLDGSLVGSPTTDVDKNGNTDYSIKCGRYDSVHRYVEWADDDSFSLGDGTTDTNLSINMDLKVVSLTNASTFLGKGHSITGDGEWNIRFPGGTGTITMTRNDMSIDIARTSTTSSPAVSADTWYNFSFVYGSAETSFTIFRDGSSLSLSSGGSASYIASENLGAVLRNRYTGDGNKEYFMNNLSIFKDYVLNNYESSILKNRY